MGYLLPAITLNRFSMFNPLMRYFSSQTIDLKQLIGNTKKWWIPENKGFAIDNIRSYNITFSEEFVNNLKSKLRNSEIVKKPNKSAYIKNNKMIILSKLLRHWAYTYDFKAGEKYINSYPQFVTNIQGLYIHFVHITRHVKKPNVEKNHMPLLLLHGWPSSIMEFYKDIQLKFAEEREIIIPSLPGFGFSSSPTILGFTCIEMSVVLKNLMLRLGHDKFRVKDGSYGANNGHIMSILFPQHVDDTLNIHDKQEMPFVKYTKRFRNTFTQANQIYTTSIYFDLNKSPNVLAEYLIEQILRADLLNVLEKKININTEMINNLMMYWRTKCIYRAMQTYKAQFEKLPTDFIDLLLHTYGIIKE